jgi:exopolysaccharide biosynthesis polyprenyl glycosylphosphotransferase
VRLRFGGIRRLHLLLLLGDLLALGLAFEGAFRLRPWLNYLFHAQLTPELLANLVPPLPLVLGCWVLASVWLRLYRERRGPWLWNAVVQVVEAMVVVVVLIIVIPFFLHEPGRAYSRSFVIFLAGLGVGTMLVVRTALWAALSLARQRGYGRERLLVVGRGHAAKALIGRLEKTAGRLVELCGVVTPCPGEAAGVLGNPVPIVGVLPDLAALINRYRIDRVVVVEKEIPSDDLHACLATCSRMGIPLSRTAGLLERSATRVGVTAIGNVTLIEVRGLEFTRVQEAVKRAFDLLVAGALLVLLAPLMLALAALIRLTSPGPALYVAPRVGRGGRHFPFLKFRSMVHDAEARRDALAPLNEQSGHLFKLKDDPRVTPPGRFMRRYSLDELPQLINVLRGDMSLVGPRPLPARDLDPDGLSHEHRFWALQRTRVPPGITGLWQVRGRSDLGFEEMLGLDVEYVRRWSVGLDVRILLKTIPAVYRRRGAC